VGSGCDVHIYKNQFLMTKKQSKIARSGDGAEFLTFFSLLWNGFVFLFYFLKPHDHIWLQLIFLGIGMFVLILTIYTWWQRMQGGNVEIQLSMNPVPHGITITANFEFSKLIQASVWSIEARFEVWTPKHSGYPYRSVWRQTFPANVTGSSHITGKFAFPSDYSQKNYDKLRKSNTRYRRILTLNADQQSWIFLIDTRDADTDESILEFQTSQTLGNNRFEVEHDKWRNLL
jgi:hypothetical protein